MAKLTLSDIANALNDTSTVNTVNANSALIETALENTLSRDGTTPNTMSANLDMNSNRIINLGAPTNNSDAVRLVDLNSTSGATGPGTSVDSEVALFSGTSGSVLKRASTTGLLKGTSGVLSAATPGIDYYSPGNTAPCGFSGYLAASVTNKTGDGTAWQLQGLTETLDTHGAFNPTTGVFTVPVAGQYLIISEILLTSVSSVNTKAVLRILSLGSTTQDFNLSSCNPYAIRNTDTNTSLSGKAIINAAVGDQITTYAWVMGASAGVKSVGAYGASTGVTIFQGHLLK